MSKEVVDKNMLHSVSFYGTFSGFLKFRKYQVFSGKYRFSNFRKFNGKLLFV